MLKNYAIDTTTYKITTKLRLINSVQWELRVTFAK